MRVLVWAALALAGSAAAAQDLAGHYLAKGTNLDGSIYEGEALITATSAFTCEIVWKTGGSTSSGRTAPRRSPG